MDDVRIKTEDIEPMPEPGAEDSITVSIPQAENVDRANADADGIKSEHEQMAPKTNYMDQLLSRTSAEELEAGVKIGLQLLNSLKTPLSAVLAVTNATQTTNWLDAIQQLQNTAKPSRTVVGVVGNTGAGKSSVINAILDEEKLVPTNGMRACTASATEISYNYSDDPSELYRAEIEFITAEDWAQELKTLLDDLLDGNGNVSNDCTNPDTDAGLAYSKIKAVYPQKTRVMIAESTPTALVNEYAVRSVVGIVKRLKETTCHALFRGLQHYVDSKEKTKGDVVRMEYWPLIKVVRIYCKSPALSTGAVIVDLPGVQDSNAARAAVAENYMKSCSGLWITAAIQRAVDDKTAKSLLGDSFKRQLKLDGQYNAVTFICTKTDDILETEVAASLNIEDEIEESWEQIEHLQRDLEKLRHDIDVFMDRKFAFDDMIEDLDSQTDEWEDLLCKLENGETVYEPSEGRKRKRSSGPSGQRKQRSSIGIESDSEADDNDDQSGNDVQHDQEDRPSLTTEVVEVKLASFRAQKRDLRMSRKDCDAKTIALRKVAADRVAEEKTLKAEIKSICIKGRNEYSRGAIKIDFAMGIKELDQEAAIDEDEDAVAPAQDVRDYDKVARSLSVFCVSARAYQKLSGRLEKDTVHVDGFTEPEDTEIPQLQKHAKRLTEGSRASDSRRFLNDLIQLLNSMKLWASSDSRVALDKKQQMIDEIFVRAQVTELQKDLHTASQGCIAAFKEALTDQLYDTFDRLVPTASSGAISVSDGWSAHRYNGGLLWSTYKATCRRSGVFSGAAGPKDFNAELFEPITKQLAGPWERVFQRLIPAALNSLVRNSTVVIETFHHAALAGLQGCGQNPAGVNMLNQQFRTRAAALSDMPERFKDEITKMQRDANREFTPIIQQSMQSAYTDCTNESGPGTFARMRATMHDHVATERHMMFQDATDHVKAKLNTMCDSIQQSIVVFVQKVAGKMERDYLAVFVGGDDAQAPGGIDLAERMLREEMCKHLAEADAWFATLFPPEDDGPVGEASHTPA